MIYRAVLPAEGPLAFGPASVVSRRRLPAWLRALGLPGILAIAISLLGLSLRIEHALTFDGPNRGADYSAFMSGVAWIREHKERFDFNKGVNSQVQYSPPLWFAAAAVLQSLTGKERSIAGLAVVGWAVRQILLALMLRRIIPQRRWSILAALAINAVLPVSVLTDGKVNPEGLHTTLFTVAVYWLWRVEREVTRREGASKISAAVFGLFAGLAMLTKATAAVLPIACVAFVLWRAGGITRRDGLGAAWRRLLVPAMVAGVVWCAVAGWWIAPNVIKYGHPFPHTYNYETTFQKVPITYRRPLGWMLPFEWKEYLALPVIESGEHPRPNFWAQTITGTWSDAINRGFCRLPGEEKTSHVWGGYDPVWGGPSVWMTLRCVRVWALLLKIGLFLTLMAFGSTIYTGWRNLRTRGGEGSLVLPIVIALGGFFVMLFALSFPYDGDAVLNARYFLPLTTPMAACFGFGLARLERSPRPGARILLGATLAAIAAVAILVVDLRWGP